MKLFLTIVSFLFLTSCAAGDIDTVLGVSPDENASFCAEFESNAPFGSAKIKRIEIPSGIDAKEITSIDDLERLDRILCPD